MCHFFPTRKKGKHKTKEISRLLNCCQRVAISQNVNTKPVKIPGEESQIKTDRMLREF